MKNIKTGAGFTLIELLVVIAILAILAVAVVLVLNPAEFVRQSRDSARLTDLSTLNKALVLYQVDGKTSFGSSSVVYVSIPDSTSTCGNLGLPDLPSGWSYNCASSTNYRKVDGSGWIPINLASISYGAVMAKLPIDPVNTTSSSQYYTYVTGGSWELTAVFESERYIPKASKDGGVDPAMFEIGSKLGIAPFVHGLVGYWKFDETGTSANDSSGFANQGTMYSSTIITDLHTSSNCKIGSCASFDGVDDYINVGNGASLNMSPSTQTIELWAYLNTDTATSKGGLITKVDSGSSNGWYFYYDNSFYYITYSGTTRHQLYIGNLIAGQWYHIAVSNNNGNAIVYINGVKKANSTGMIWTQGTSNVWIGSFEIAPTTYVVNGRIDEVRVYNRALSAAEISAIYNATK